MPSREARGADQASVGPTEPSSRETLHSHHCDRGYFLHV